MPDETGSVVTDNAFKVLEKKMTTTKHDVFQT